MQPTRRCPRRPGPTRHYTVGAAPPLAPLEARGGQAADGGKKCGDVSHVTGFFGRPPLRGLRVLPSSPSSLSTKASDPQGRPVFVLFRIILSSAWLSPPETHADQSGIRPPVVWQGSQQRIASQTTVSRGTGPSVVFRPLHHPCPNGIPLHVAQRRPEMGFIQNGGKESTLPKTSAKRVLLIKVTGVRAKQVTHRPGEGAAFACVIA